MHKRVTARRKWATALAVVVVAVLGVGGFVTAAQATQGEDGWSVYQWHFFCRGEVGTTPTMGDTNAENCPAGTKAIKIPGATNPLHNEIDGLESDGPYPGATQLADLGEDGDQGSNSGDLWVNDGSRQTSWVECAPGKVALGGGFHLAADAGDTKARQVQVVVSEPTGAAIDGDPAGSVLPNGWQVQGFYDGDGSVVVRPWVICAEVQATE